MYDQAQSARLGQRTQVESPGIYIAADAAAMPEAPYEGQQTWRSDLGAQLVYVNGVWTAPTLSEDDEEPITVPTGAMMMWMTLTAPAGWLLLNGSTYLISAYPSLWALMGPSGANQFALHTDGVSFIVPDMRGRLPLGMSSSYDLGQHDTASEATRTLNLDHNHTLTGTAASGGAHTHNITGQGGGTPTVSVGGGAVESARFTQYDQHDHTGATGSSGAHTHTVSGSTAQSTANDLPYMVMNFIVKT